MMLPDFTAHGYEVIKDLNHNFQGGRITYLAWEIVTQKPVVIKKFRFATTNNWDGYKAIEKEIQVLKGLIHSGIPRYLTQFDSGDGLCLVQEYINAQPLSQPRSFSLEEITSIARQILEILVYLQKRIPPIFHRDIKPENVLVDENIKAYLIDFGIAHIGNNSLAISSMFGGTLGFMSPEQIQDKEITEASDLYGLGATLICLITETKSANIGRLMNLATNKITFKDQVPQLNFQFVQWLEKMVEPNPVNRYQNAQSALTALRAIELNSNAKNNWHWESEPRYPIREFEDAPSQLSYDEVLARLGLENINNLAELVTASKIHKDIANQQSGESKLRNQGNVKVNNKFHLLPPYTFIGIFTLFLTVISRFSLQCWLFLSNNSTLQTSLENYLIWGGLFLIITLTLGDKILALYTAIIGAALATDLLKVIGERIGNSINDSIVDSIVGSITVSIGGSILGLMGIFVGAVLGFLIGLATAKFIGQITKNGFLAIMENLKKIIDNLLEENFHQRGFNDWAVTLYVLFSAAIGILIGIGTLIGFSFQLLAVLAVFSIPLTSMLVYPQWDVKKLEVKNPKR